MVVWKVIKAMLRTPLLVFKAWLATFKGIPAEVRLWWKYVGDQHPLVYDPQLAATRGIDPTKIYALPIGYRLLFFWLWWKMNGGPTQNPHGFGGVFSSFDVKSFLGNLFISRASDGYCYTTQRWLGIWGPKPTGFSLDEIIQVTIVDIDATQLEAAGLGIIQITAQLAIGTTVRVEIPILGEGSSWVDPAGNVHVGISGVVSFLEAQIALCKDLKAATP